MTEAFTVSVDEDGRYRIELDHAVNVSKAIVVTVNSVVLSAIPYGDTLDAGQYGIQTFEDAPAILELHSSKNGLAGTVAYTPICTQVTAGRMNKMEKQLQWASAAAWRSASIPMAPVAWAAGQAPTASIYLNGNGRAALTMCRVWVTADDLPATETSTFYVTSAATPTGGIEVSLGSDEYRAVSADGAVEIDVDPATWLNVYCTAGGGHQQITIGVEFA